MVILLFSYFNWELYSQKNDIRFDCRFSKVQVNVTDTEKKRKQEFRVLNKQSLPKYLHVAHITGFKLYLSILLRFLPDLGYVQRYISSSRTPRDFIVDVVLMPAAITTWSSNMASLSLKPAFIPSSARVDIFIPSKQYKNY